MKKIILVFLACSTMLLSACSNIPLTTIYKMMTMNPLDVDPRQLVVAVGSPKGISIQTGDVVIHFEYKTPQSNVTLKHEFFVQVNPNYKIPTELKEEVEDNNQITVLQLSKHDAEAMYQAQKKIKAYKQKYDDGLGKFTIQIKASCMTKSYLKDELELDLFLKLKDDEEFFTFMEDIDVMELKNKQEMPSNKMTECSAR
ncbi:hypothetical protein SOPP22_14970 [Shewanella sp. OPT22]|nr:hypothetical protein SOPP22_14970 [Shewanella sp. OPT22]